jgi:hypothetical protein
MNFKELGLSGFSLEPTDFIMAIHTPTSQLCLFWTFLCILGLRQHA